MPDSVVDLGSEVVDDDRRPKGLLCELELHSIYNPLDYSLGKLDSEKLASLEDVYKGLGRRLER